MGAVPNSMENLVSSTAASGTSNAPANRTRVTLTITAIVIAVVVIAFFVVANLYTDVLWFDQLGFSSVLLTQWTARVVMFLIGFVATGLVIWVSIAVAFRSRPLYQKLNSQLDRYQQVIIPEGEEPAANALRVNDVVMVGSDFPRTIEMLDKLGYKVVPVKTTEIGKIDAGLSCMSLRWRRG